MNKNELIAKWQRILESKAQTGKGLLRAYRARCPRPSGVVLGAAVTGQTRNGYYRHLSNLPSRAEKVANGMRTRGIWSVPAAWLGSMNEIDRHYANVERQRDAESYAASLSDTLCASAARALKAGWPFRRSQSGWAGGNHSVSVTLGSAVAGGGSERVWSDNGKWSGTDSFARLTVSARAIQLYPTLMARGGEIILDVEDTDVARVRRVTIATQARGFDLSTEQGYLIHHHYLRAASPISALRKFAKIRARALGEALRTRDQLRSKRGELRDYSRVFVSIEDSIAAGNCDKMTRQFAKQIWRELGALGECAVRADVILRARDDSFTRRAVARAMAR